MTVREAFGQFQYPTPPEATEMIEAEYARAAEQAAGRFATARPAGSR